MLGSSSASAAACGSRRKTKEVRETSFAHAAALLAARCNSAAVVDSEGSRGVGDRGIAHRRVAPPIMRRGAASLRSEEDVVCEEDKVRAPPERCTAGRNIMRMTVERERGRERERAGRSAELRAVRLLGLLVKDRARALRHERCEPSAVRHAGEHPRLCVADALLGALERRCGSAGVAGAMSVGKNAGLSASSLCSAMTAPRTQDGREPDPKIIGQGEYVVGRSRTGRRRGGRGLLVRRHCDGGTRVHWLHCRGVAVRGGLLRAARSRHAVLRGHRLRSGCWGRRLSRRLLPRDAPNRAVQHPEVERVAISAVEKSVLRM